MATSSPVDPEALRAKMFPSYTHNYSHRDAILYALALGCTTKDLQHVYEHHPAFRPLPLYSIIAAHPAVSSMPLDAYIPGFDKAKGLHGEQFLKVLAPLPPHGQLVTQPYLVDVRDKGKGKGAVVVVKAITRDALLGHDVSETEFVLYILGAGGFGTPWQPFPRPAAACDSNQPPNRPPDAETLVTTSEDQAALYRLCGDYNPLHIDPCTANKLGFPRPILHGLCTMGLSVKAVVETLAQGEFESLKTAKVRFSRPCVPGDQLRVRMWHVPQNERASGWQKVVFETSIVGSGSNTGKETVVITGGAVEFESLHTEPASKL